MAMDSPVISDQDSLIEEVPIQTEDNLNRGTESYSTFTRKRPGNLSSSQRKKRPSLMSPQSIPNLDTDDLLTPDFAMTQSMYEPLEKRKQQEKLEENSRLLKLIASEKSSQAAQERKLKEIKKKAIENKKRNEEKQKLVEERRLRMLADQEAKKSQLIKKINLPTAVTNSYYGSMTKSVPKYKSVMGSGFMDRRPMSSTGKIFGFGSSAPRDVCEKLTTQKFHAKDACMIEIRKPEQTSSRMWTSQIVHSSNSKGETKSRMIAKENQVKPMASSNVNISSLNKALIKNRKAATNTSGENLKSRKRVKTPETPEPRSPRPKNGTPKSPFTNLNIPPVEKPRGRSLEKVKNSSSNITTIPELRPRPTERKKTPTKHERTETPNTKHEQHKIAKPEQNIKRTPSPKPGQVPTIKKRTAHNSEPKYIPSAVPIEKQTEPPRKFEVRFEENESAKDDDSNLISESSLSIERPRTTTSNVTEEEYKRRISLQRKLAKEKRRKQQEEKELQEQNRVKEIKEFEQQVIENSESVVRDDRLHSESSETNVEEIKIDSSSSSEQPSKEPVVNKTPKSPVYIKEPATSSQDVPTIEFPKAESAVGMTASVEALDRIERKKRINSIMSRIKKPIGGSSESVTQHVSTTTLQDMLDKGHLSGMSKTAAILMRSSQQTSDLSGSSLDLPNSLDSRQSKSQEILVPSENIEESRGSCDGQEDLNNNNNVEQSLTTKSSLMDNLVSNSSKPYLSSWAEKYSDSYSLDTEDGNAV